MVPTAVCLWLVRVQRHKTSAMRAHSIEMLGRKELMLTATNVR